MRRLWDMLSGEKEAKENFKYLSKHGIRGMVQIFVSDEKIVDALTELIPENVLTGFHLKDIFDSSKKLNDLKKLVYDTVLFNKRFPKSLEIDKAITTEREDKDKKKEIIDFDLVAFFKDQGCLDCINKL